MRISDWSSDGCSSDLDWTPATNMAFMSKFIGSTDRSFIFQVFTSDTLRLIWTTDGTAGTQVSATSTVAPTIANGDDLWIRVKLDVDNGAGGNDAIFETSTNGVTWTQQIGRASCRERGCQYV